VRIALTPFVLSLEGAAAYVSLSEASIQKLVRENRFPKPRLLSDRRVGWLVRELEEWAGNCPVSDLLPPPNTSHGNRKHRAKE
jgi:prophage regulatory protein